MVALALMMAAFAILNHVRGGSGLFGPRVLAVLDRIPGNGDMHAASFVALLAWLAGLKPVLFPVLAELVDAGRWLSAGSQAWPQPERPAT